MVDFHWREYDLVHRQLREARDSAKAMCGSDESCPFVSVLDRGKHESPIEAVFAIWLEFLFMYGGQVGSRSFYARPQQTIEIDGERFRPDFIIVPTEPLLAALGDAAGSPMKIAVELDGYDFHERTKEQVTLRDRRDRVLQRHGWIVLHISGSELVRTQVEALKEVWLCAEAQLQKLREAVAKEWGAPLKYEAV